MRAKHIAQQWHGNDYLSFSTRVSFLISLHSIHKSGHLGVGDCTTMGELVLPWLLLVKCYDNKMVNSPFNYVISPLTHPQVANQQQQKNCQAGSRMTFLNVLTLSVPPNGLKVVFTNFVW